MISERLVTRFNRFRQRAFNCIESNRLLFEDDCLSQTILQSVKRSNYCSDYFQKAQKEAAYECWCVSLT